MSVKSFEEYLNEMALPLNKAKQRFTAYKYEILDHYIKTLIMPNDSAKNHWKKELDGFLKSLKKVKIKSTKAYVTRERALEWLFVDKDDFIAAVYNIKDEYPRSQYSKVQHKDFIQFISVEFDR